MCDVLILVPNTAKKSVNDSNNENDDGHNGDGDTVFKNRIRRL